MDLAPAIMPPRFPGDRRNYNPVMKILSLMNARMDVFALALALAGAVSAQNFTLTLQPSAVTLIPNQNASFVVSMTPLNGFTSQVALAMETLPFGVTAQFSPAALTPPGTSILTLSAATNADLNDSAERVHFPGGTGRGTPAVRGDCAVLPGGADPAGHFHSHAQRRHECRSQ